MNKEIINLRNYQKIRVEQLENKNQFVITYDNSDKTTKENTRIFAFQSYDILICMWLPYEHRLYVNWRMWDYSKTTLKHLKIFINSYTSLDYYNKQQFLKLLTSDNNIVLFDEQ